MEKAAKLERERQVKKRRELEVVYLGHL